ncbi:hypothetical protein F4677DRAFT_457763 [Hypoxylon crocopeplum]|nr:hypothetical protein F4677DRAFT_457763 [Hypoxylon crocopeplum]
MQRYEDDDALLRPIQRRETTPARLMGQVLRQPTNSFGQRASPPPAPFVRDGAPVSAYYPPYYPGGPPQTVPVYYQPHPMQFIRVQPPPDFSTVDLPGNHTSVDSRRSKSRSRRMSVGEQLQSDGAYAARDRRRDRASRTPVETRRRGRYDDDDTDDDTDTEDTGASENPELIAHARSELRRLGRGHALNEDEFEDTTSATVYSFTPSRISRAVSAQPSMYADEESPEEHEGNVNDGGGGVRKELGHTLRLSHIFESQYSGDHTLGGSQSVNLTAVISNRVGAQPLFRWLHCTRNSMDFGEFSNEVMGVPSLTVAEKKGIRDLLARVQRKFVKIVQTADGRRVRHMEPGCIQHVLPPDGTSKTSSFGRHTTTWVCLPYFTLEKYSGLQGDAENTSTFPIETRERDMRQAVCQSKDTPAGLCFHIAQIWCVVVDNSFLFTYSRMSQDALRGDSIDLSTKTIQEISSARRRAIITVSYRQSVLWAIPVEECRTWLDFISHFREFWPRRLQFFRRRRPVTANDWLRAWNMARHVSDKILLEMRIGTAPDPPPTDVLIPKNIDQGVEGDREDMQRTSRAASEKLPPGRKGRSMPQKAESTAPSTLSISSCLVDDYLLSRTSFSDRRAYATCPEATRDEIYAHLEKEGIKLSELSDSSRTPQRNYEAQLDVFNAADVLFSFFFPPNVKVPTISRFWGALRAILTDGKHSIITDIRLELRRLCVEVQTFKEMFAQSGKLEQAKIAVPKEIVEGWIHLLMGLIYLLKDHDKSDRLLNNARDLIRSGMATIIRSLSDKSLLDSSVVLPLELLSLLSLKLLQDFTVGMPDISECYSACLSSVEADIASKPSDRYREYRIGLLMKEILVVQRIVKTQTSIFWSLGSFVEQAEETDQGERSGEAYPSGPAHYIDSRDQFRQSSNARYYARESTRARMPSDYREGPIQYSSYLPPQPRSRTRSYAREEPAPYYYEEGLSYVAANPPPSFELASTDPGGYRVLLQNECLQFLAGRERDFSGFRGWAASLRDANRNKIDTTKDRHENAIYAFTIVTIIFLPLSAVASIFGMNTRDVRDMDLDQWAYWAAAVPVTAAVIFLGLLWTGELGNISRWVQSFVPRQQGYQSLPDDLYLEYRRGPPSPPPPPGPPQPPKAELLY